jgi:bifunctional non-homologous end joining protein LigD
MRPPVFFYAFDLLRLNGKDLQNLPIEERKAKLEELLKKPAGAIRYSISFTRDIEELLERARSLGLEGLIAKRSGSRYEAGKRTGAWIKIKLHLEQEFVIGGYTNPDGARKHFGALLVGKPIDAMANTSHLRAIIKLAIESLTILAPYLYEFLG